MKVYIVTTGEYSDYRVFGVFSTKENADKCIAMTFDRGDWPEVSEYTVDEGSEYYAKGCNLWFVRMDREGRVLAIDKYRGSTMLSPWFTYYSHPNLNNGEVSLLAHVWAENPQNATQIVNDYRAQAIALGTWGKE